jgi:hypothetical protein
MGNEIEWRGDYVVMRSEDMQRSLFGPRVVVGSPWGLHIHGDKASVHPTKLLARVEML